MSQQLASPLSKLAVTAASSCSSVVLWCVCVCVCVCFFKSSGGWVKIKLKLPHFHVYGVVSCMYNHRTSGIKNRADMKYFATYSPRVTRLILVQVGWFVG